MKSLILQYKETFFQQKTVKITEKLKFKKWLSKLWPVCFYNPDLILVNFSKLLGENIFTYKYKVDKDIFFSQILYS